MSTINNRTVGIVVALLSEARAITSKKVSPLSVMSLGDGVVLCVSGMGAVAAERAAVALADAGVGALAVIGVTGALDGTLSSGTLICPERVIDESGHVYTPDASWRTRVLAQSNTASLPIRSDGCLLTVATPLLTTATKRAACERFSAIAVDMESAAVGAIAMRGHLPFIALRAVVDELVDTVPAALNESIDAWGRPKPINLMLAFARRPSLLAELPRLYSRMKRATESLNAVARTLGPKLTWQA